MGIINEIKNLGAKNQRYQDMYKNVLQERKVFSMAWKESGLLKGLKGHDRMNMAQLLENQKRELLREANTTGDITGFQNIALPIVRRVFGGLLANKIVSVQPMSLPSGLVFYLDYKYATGKGTQGRSKAGNQNLQWVSGDSIYGNPLAQQLQQTGALATGGHYNLMSSYTRMEHTVSVPADGSFGTGSVTDWADVGYDPALSASIAAGGIYFYTAALDTTNFPSLDEAMYKNFTISGTATGLWNNVVGMYKQHNTWDSANRKLKGFYSSSTALLHFQSASMNVCYVQGPTQTVGTVGSSFAPEFESDFSTDLIPEIDIQINAINVQAVGRKLKAKWTPELAQDINAYQNIDAEAELTTILSEQIAMDIDAEILGDILNKAKTNYFWSRDPGIYVNKTTGVQAPGPTFTGNVTEWYWTLMETINDVANQIHKKTLRGAANFLVVSPEIATIMESMLLYKPVMNLDTTELQFSVGTEKIGTLSNRYQVYKCVYFPSNKVLVGFKGSSYLENYYCYCPYVPLIVSPTIYDPDRFEPRKAVMTRYGRVCIRPDGFGTVTVRDI